MVELKELKNHKACSKCHTVKNKREFYTHPETKYGLHSWCRGCQNTYTNDSGRGRYHSDA